jgi:hypothetical protein
VFERLRQVLESQVKKVANPDLHSLGVHVSEAILQSAIQTMSHAGFRSGVMFSNLAHVGFPEFTANGSRIGIAKEQVDHPAPSGTISAFLQDYPQYKGYFESPKKAWSWLKPEAKRLLALGRMSGLYGGESGKSSYWMEQNEGAMDVGIEPRHFIEAGLKVIPSEVDRLMREALQ